MKWQNSYRQLIDNGSEGIVIINENMLIIDANTRILKMLGYRPAEFKKLALSDIIKEDKTEYKKSCLANLKGSKFCLFEEILICKDGTLIDVEISGKKFSDGAFIAFIRDISERKKARDIIKYHSFVLQNLREAVISTDLSLKILSWNAAAEKLYGWTEEEVLGKKLTAVLKTRLINDFKDNMVATLRTCNRWSGEVIQESKSGKKSHISTSVQVVKNANDEVIGYIAINIDISEKISFENLIKENNQEFKKIAWMQSHELRAPLTNILGLLEIVDLQNESRDYNNQILKYIKASANKIDAVIKQIVETTLITNEQPTRSVSSVT